MATSGGATPGRAMYDRVDVAIRGDIPYDAHRWATQAVLRAVQRDTWRLRSARVRLTRPPHLVAVCRADIQADLDGHLFHVRAEARDARTALATAAERLQRQIAAVHAGEAAGLRRPRPAPGPRPARPR
jgi:hypothetical protein